MQTDKNYFKNSKLIKKLVESVTKLSKRLNSSGLSREFKSSLPSLSNSNPNLTQSASTGNLNFIRYIDELVSHQSNEFLNQNRTQQQQQTQHQPPNWEVLSHIYHTPRSLNNVNNLANNNHCNNSSKIVRHRSLNDITNRNYIKFNRNRVKKVEKVNELLDFLLHQLLKTQLNCDEDNNFGKIIQNLILECCVEIAVTKINEVKALMNNKVVTNSDYISIMCSSEISNSDSDPVDCCKLCPNHLEISTQKLNNFQKHSSVICLASNSPKKHHKSKVGFNNHFMSPNSDNSTFHYISKKQKSKIMLKRAKRSTKIYKVKSNAKFGQELDDEMNDEYQCYVTAKKACSNNVKPKANHEDQNAKFVKIESGKLNKSEMDKNAEIITYSPFYKMHRFQNTYSYKSTKKDCDKSKPIKSAALVVAKASSIECIDSDNNKDIEINKSSIKNNVKVTSIKYVDEPDLKKKQFIITPVNITYVGQDSKDNKTCQTNLEKGKICKSVVTNSIFSDSALNIGSNNKLLRKVTIKSASGYGKYSFSTNIKRKISISNHCVVKPNISDSTLSDYFSQPTTFNAEFSNSELVKFLLDYKNVNASIFTNDGIDGELSETEQMNTNCDSHLPFQAVKAKYFQHISVPVHCSNSDSSSKSQSKETQQNKEHLDTMSQCVSIDPNPEEVKDVYERVMDIHCWSIDQNSTGKTYTFDDDKNNHAYLRDLPTFLNSQSVMSKYNTSSDDDSKISDNKPLAGGTMVAESITQIPIDSDASSVHDVASGDKYVPELVPDDNGDGYRKIGDYNSQKATSDNGIRKSNSKRCLNRNISENLMRHTFASQQKIRLKRE